MAVAGMETEVAEDTQMILGDALQRLADEADDPGLQILESAEIIEQLAGEWVGVERVDGEIPSSSILLPVVGEGDGRPAPVGRYIRSKRSDFGNGARRYGGDGAMVDAGRD